MPANNIIQLRKGSSSDWTTTDPILASGEPGYETNTGRLKIGDGSTLWSNLSYSYIHPTGLIAGSGIDITTGTNGASKTISVVDNLTVSSINIVNNEADLYWNNVVLLLRMNGGITDISNSAHSITANDNAAISTTQIKYGTHSLYLDGSSSLTIPYSSDFDFGTGDFTIEYWMWGSDGYADNPSNPMGVFAGGGYPNGYTAYAFGGGSPGGIDFAANQDGGGWGGSTLASPPPSDQTWHHIAFVRSSGELKVYIDGVGGTGVSFAGSITCNSEDIQIGRDRSSNLYNFNGYLDDIRVTKGIARYTSNFTPSEYNIGAVGSYVGIGTNTPLYNLDVDGSGNFSDSLFVNGVPVSVSGHLHLSTDISDFNSAVSGILPVIDITAGTNISISSSSGNFTINSAAGESFHPFLLGGM